VGLSPTVDIIVEEVIDEKRQHPYGDRYRKKIKALLDAVVIARHHQFEGWGNAIPDLEHASHCSELGRLN